MDELMDEFTETKNGLLIGPIPKDEDDRKRLMEVIEKGWEDGRDFCPAYLLEYIYTDESREDELACRLGTGYAVINGRLHGPTVETAEEAKSLYKQALEWESTGIWVSPSWVEHLWEVMDEDE